MKSKKLTNKQLYMMDYNKKYKKENPEYFKKLRRAYYKKYQLSIDMYGQLIRISDSKVRKAFNERCYQNQTKYRMDEETRPAYLKYRQEWFAKNKLAIQMQRDLKKVTGFKYLK